MASGIEQELETTSASGVGALWRENAALKQENGRLAQALEHAREIMKAQDEDIADLREALRVELARAQQALAHERVASEAYKNERNALENKIHDLKAEALRHAEATERRAVEVLIATRKALAGCRAVLSRAEFSLEDSARELGIDLDTSEG